MYYFAPDLVVVGTEAVSAFSTSSLTSKSSERIELKDRFRISRKLKLSDFSIFGRKKCPKTRKSQQSQIAELCINIFAWKFYSRTHFKRPFLELVYQEQQY